MNLADSKKRDVQQQDQIGRRPSIIAEQRNTRAPALETFATLRTARRGDGGAAELLRTLGLAEKAATNFQQYAQNSHAEREETNIARGAADQQTGHVDTAMLERSDGYRNAVTKGRTMSAFNDAQREVDEELRGLIERQDAPSLELRQQQVKDRLEAFYHDFALDSETGQLKDFMQSPDAMRYLASAISSTRPQFEAAAMQRIEERFNAEARGHLGKNVVDQLRNTESLDLELALSTVPKTVPDEAVAATFVSSLPQAAAALWQERGSIAGLQMLDAVLGKPNALRVPVPSAPEGAPADTAGQPATTAGRVSFDTLAAAVMHQESRGNPKAVSPKGAVGRMQTMPSTLTDPGYGVTPAGDRSERELTRVGRDYLQAMLREYNGDLVLALAAYNAGPARANAWKDDLAGKSLTQKVAAIPFKETRDYVRNILTRTGAMKGTGVVEGGAATAPDDPVQGTPTFRLQRPAGDPVTAYEQSGDVPALAGIERLKLSTDDRAKLREARDQLASRMRSEWTRKMAEEQEFNATGMALRLYGQGEALTSVEITQALRSGAVTPQAGMTLYGLLRSNANAAQAFQDRLETQAERDQRKSQEDAAATISGRYVASILAGRMSGAEARGAVLRELPQIKDPRVQTAVATAVLGAAGDIEQLMVNSAPTRDAVRRVTDSREWFASRITQGGHAAAAAAKMLPQVDAILDTAASEIALRVRDGAKPEEAEREVLAKYRPKLMQLTAPRPVRR